MIYLVTGADVVDEGDRSIQRDFVIPAFSRWHRQLAGALSYFQHEVAAFGRVDEPSQFVQRQTFLLEFVVDDNKLAVKAFESLDDRGKPLTLLERTKSYLMFNSVRYHDSRLDKKINELFGEIFRCDDAMKDIGARASIEYVNSGKFTEDGRRADAIFYHYFASFAIGEHKLGGRGAPRCR